MAKHALEMFGGKVTEIENKIRLSEIEKRSRTISSHIGELDAVLA